MSAGERTKATMSDRLGHATSAFTQDIYMHAIPAKEEAAADRIADLVFGSIPSDGEDEPERHDPDP